MGSGASRNVGPIDEGRNGANGAKTSGNGKTSTPSSPQRGSSDAMQTSCTTENGAETEIGSVRANDERESKTDSAEIEREMERLQSDNLDLQEQIQALEERLQTVTTDQQVAQQENDFSVTIQAKDQFIDKQQEELNAAQKQLKILRVKYKRKLKSVNEQLSEAKHEWSLQVFELKQQISQLREENTKLEENNNAGTILDSSFNHDDGRKSTLEESCDSRMKIILELSNKVSDQDTKIISLENKIRQQEKTIESERSNSASRKHRSNRNSTQNSTFEETVLNGESKEFDELKSIAEEMKLLKRNKKKKVRVKVAKDDDIDYRQASGLSRDSGIASAEISAEKQHVPRNLSKGSRVQSAASTVSGFSQDHDEAEGHNLLDKDYSNFVDDQDSWDESDNEQETKYSRKIELRQISAPKNKKKTKTSDFDYIDSLLTNPDKSHFFNHSTSEHGYIAEFGGV